MSEPRHIRVSQTPAQLIRDVDARNSARKVYRAAYESLSRKAQAQDADGKPLSARMTRRRAALALRAFHAEALL